jgi:hypothetical protein
MMLLRQFNNRVALSSCNRPCVIKGLSRVAYWLFSGQRGEIGVDKRAFFAELLRALLKLLNDRCSICPLQSQHGFAVYR